MLPYQTIIIRLFGRSGYYKILVLSLLNLLSFTLTTQVQSILKESSVTFKEKAHFNKISFLEIQGSKEGNHIVVC